MKDKSRGWAREFDTIWDESFVVHEYIGKVPVYRVCNKLYMRMQKLIESIHNKEI